MDKTLGSVKENYLVCCAYKIHYRAKYGNAQLLISGLKRVPTKILNFLFLKQAYVVGTQKNGLKTFVQTDGLENIYIFKLQIFVDLNLCRIDL